MFKKNIKKGFTLLELIFSTIIITFVFAIIITAYNSQKKIIDDFNIKVFSTSLGQQGYNFINYLFLSRKIKYEKEVKKKIIQNIIDNNSDTDIFLDFWINKGLQLFYNNNSEIPPNDIQNDSYWTLFKQDIDGEVIWGFKKILGPDDTDNMINVNNFNVFNLGEDRNGPFYYIQITKIDTGVKYKGNPIYKLKFTEHFLYKKYGKNNDYTFNFEINPLLLK